MDAKTKFLRKFGGSQHYGDRQLAVFAVLTAVGANLIFWGLLFKYREPETTVKDSGSSLELLDLSSPDAGYWRRWICYNDPAKSGNSAYRGGFSAQLPRLELFDPPAARPRHNPERQAPEIRGFQQAELSNRTSVAGFPAPNTERETVDDVPPELPMATDDRGRNIRIVGDAGSVRSASAIRDTMLLVTSAGGKANLIVWESCGDKVLDVRAAGMVAAAVGELDPLPAYVTIRWPRRAEAEVEK